MFFLLIGIGPLKRGANRQGHGTSRVARAVSFVGNAGRNRVSDLAQRGPATVRMSGLRQQKATVFAIAVPDARRILGPRASGALG